MKRLYVAFFVMSIISVILLFSSSATAGQGVHVVFYGVAANVDKNMLDMTKNLYLMQLKDIEGITVEDKSRDEVLDISALDSIKGVGIAVYANIEVSSEDTSLWVFTLCAKNTADGTVVSVTREYTSYYKILTEAKETVADLMERMRSKPAQTDTGVALSPISASIESLAGTWQGENYIAKIIILRGGRGFIIYKNGATMNVNVSISSSSEDAATINISQAGKPNASFYPELPRKAALENAPNAKPMQWTLSLTNNDTLEGVRVTLVEDPDSPGGVKEGEMPVLWTRSR